MNLDSLYESLLESDDYYNRYKQRVGTFYYKPNEKLPEDMVKIFTDLGRQQRGSPEDTMMKIVGKFQLYWLGEMLEHLGDLIHGFADAVRFDGNIVRDVERKLTSASRSLGPYFKQNMEQLERNIKLNAEKKGIDPRMYRKQIEDNLAIYAAEHFKLPAYNEVHLLCKKITTSLGGMQFNECKRYVDELLRYAADGTLSRRNLTITRDRNGVIRKVG